MQFPPVRKLKLSWKSGANKCNKAPNASLHSLHETLHAHHSSKWTCSLYISGFIIVPYPFFNIPKYNSKYVSGKNYPKFGNKNKWSVDPSDIILEHCHICATREELSLSENSSAFQCLQYWYPRHCYLAWWLVDYCPTEVQIEYLV